MTQDELIVAVKADLTKLNSIVERGYAGIDAGYINPEHRAQIWQALNLLYVAIGRALEHRADCQKLAGLGWENLPCDCGLAEVEGFARNFKEGG